MADGDLLTPEEKGRRVWTILVCLAVYMAVVIWQVHLDRQLIRDNFELSSIDFINTVICLYYGPVAIIRLCSAGVLAFIKKYGLKPSLLYVGFVTVISYGLVVYVMDWTAVGTTRVLQDHLFTRLEKSVVEIEERRGPIKQRHMTGAVPYSVEEHTKYAGEDVVFDCYRMVTYPTDIYPSLDQVVWEKDGKKIQSSDRINISWTFENITDEVANNGGYRHYLISSKLTISFLATVDFGNYTCMVKNSAIAKLTVPKSPPKPQLPMCPLEPPPPCMCICLVVCDNAPALRTPPPPPQSRLELPMDKGRWRDKYHIVKVFSLVPMQELTRVVHAPPGGLVSFTATYDHNGDIDDISFHYTIGGEPFDSVCGKILDGCSLSVTLYWLLYHKGGHDMFLTARIGNARMRTAVTGTGWQCVCKKAYDYHEFWFFRTFFNMTSGREEILAFRYPQRVLLAPRTPDLFFYNFTNKVDPLATEPCWVRPKRQTLVPACEQEQERIEWTLWIFLHLEAAVYVVTAIMGIIAVPLVSRLLTKTVVIPVRNKILEGSFFPCKGCVKTKVPLGCIHEDDKLDTAHDVFISHAESSLSDSYQLTQILETLNLSVFLPDRDVLGGQYKTEAISRAIASSRLFVVLLTEEYIKSGMQNRFEFQLILKKALEKTAHYKNLLIVKRDEVYVPTPLTEFCMLDWTTNSDMEGKCRRLRNWSEGKVNSGHVCDC